MAKKRAAWPLRKASCPSGYPPRWPRNSAHESVRIPFWVEPPRRRLFLVSPFRIQPWAAATAVAHLACACVARHLTLRHLTLPCRGQWQSSLPVAPGNQPRDSAGWSRIRVTAVGPRAKAIPGYFQLVSPASPILWVRRRVLDAAVGCVMCVRQARAPNKSGSPLRVRARLAAVSSSN